MTLRIAMPTLALLALAACTGMGSAWVKEGATREEIRADEAACRAQAEALQGRSTAVTDDIRGSLRGGRDANRRIVTDTRDLDTARNYERVIERCMHARGYIRPKT